jgi:hypothetical protein
VGCETVPHVRKRHKRDHHAQPDEEERRRARPEIRLCADRREQRGRVSAQRHRDAADAEPERDESFLARGARGIEPRADRGAREHKARPRQQHERGHVRRGPQVRLDRVGQHRHPAGRPDERRHHRRRHGRRRQQRCPGPPSAAGAPQERRRNHRDAHDVQDVDLEQRPRRPAADDPRLQAEEECEPEYLPPAAPRQRGDFVLGAAPAHARAGRERERDAGQKEEDRRAGKAADEGNPVIGGARPFGGSRPRVDHVPLDHDEDADAAQPVEIPLPIGRRNGRGLPRA